MAGKFFEAFASLAKGLPEIKKPLRAVRFTEKLFWTGIVLVIYLIMAETPLYGIALGGQDPFALMRVIFASRRGTLMELGIGPIVTAGLILQLLVGSRMIELDMSKPKDRAIFTAANKVFAIVMTAFEALIFVFGGVYGHLELNIALIVFLQLLGAGVIVILLDELVQKGWGIGSGISLFIAAGVAQQIFWSCFAPIVAGDGYFVGAILALLQSVFNGQVGAVIIRSGGLPDMVGFISMIIIFLVVIYLEGLRVEIPISYARFRGFRGSYPVKFFYVSNIPVILASALFSNIYFFSNILSSRFPNSFITGFLGTVDPTTGMPTGGLIYYLTPPRDFGAFLVDPARALIYTLILVGVCALFSITWVEVAGLSSRDVAEKLIGAGLQVPGFRRAEKPIKEILDRYIPTVTVLGGVTVGLIAAVADFFSTFGSGIGILLTTGIMWQYYQLLVRERVEEMYPGISKMLGF
ncbi:MAG: preprotein translocase subunit SecY [Candidatus Bathyarchaeota archaeon]